MLCSVVYHVDDKSSNQSAAEKCQQKDAAVFRQTRLGDLSNMGTLLQAAIGYGQPALNSLH